MHALILVLVFNLIYVISFLIENVLIPLYERKRRLIEKQNRFSKSNLITLEELLTDSNLEQHKTPIIFIKY